MLHLQYPNFSTTQSYSPNVTLAVSQFQHHTKLHSICYTCSIAILAPHKATLQMLHLQYPNFSTPQSYTPNVTLAVSQFQHHTKLHSICYTCSIQISALQQATIYMLHFAGFVLKFNSNLPVRRACFLLNAVFGKTILYIISRVHYASFVITLPKQLRHSSCPPIITQPPDLRMTGTAVLDVSSCQ